MKRLNFGKCNLVSYVQRIQTFTATCLSPSKLGLFKMPEYNSKLLKVVSESSIKYQFSNH